MTPLSIPPVRARFSQTPLAELPAMYKVRQRFAAEEIKAVESVLSVRLHTLTETSLVGKKIAVTAGSRGIRDIGKVAGAEVLDSEEFLAKEPELRHRAKQLMGRLLIDEVDVLIVDFLEYSGQAVPEPEIH